jgi:hypothetical protein
MRINMYRLYVLLKFLLGREKNFQFNFLWFFLLFSLCYRYFRVHYFTYTLFVNFPVPHFPVSTCTLIYSLEEPSTPIPRFPGLSRAYFKRSEFVDWNRTNSGFRRSCDDFRSHSPFGLQWRRRNVCLIYNFYRSILP